MFRLYTVQHVQHNYLSIFPAVDQLYWQLRGKEVLDLSPPLSIGQAYAILQENRGGEQECPFLSDDLPPFVEQSPDSWKRLEQFSVTLLFLLGGRALLWEEIVACLQMHWGINLNLKKILAGIQWLYLHKQVGIRPAVTSIGAAATWRCNRCDAKREDLFISSCACCGDQCVSCDNCIPLGRCRSCTPLFLFSARKKSEKSNTPLQLPSLTLGQQKVADCCIQWLQGEEKELLVWAVTGSGKTEILLPAVKSVLDDGGSVLWVTPRRDVVLELSPRLKKAFPELDIVTLYRGSGQLWAEGRLVVATAHQAWRFYRMFQLVVVDEVDAYPLLGNQMLQAGVVRAGCRSGKRILLTATPLERWQKKAGKRLPTVLLPARYHGYPLPVPQMSLYRKLWSKLIRGEAVPSLELFIQQVMEQKGQGLLFVPRVQDVEAVLSWLRQRTPEVYPQSAGASAQDRDRRENIRFFRSGKVRILVTTTILERGVTVPTCHVAVVGADHRVFDKSSLIQIAGRVGRSAAYQQGQVLFIATEATEGQRRAIGTIKEINRQAHKKGLLRTTER